MQYMQYESCQILQETGCLSTLGHYMAIGDACDPAEIIRLIFE
jgi:hypothetical protein